MAINFSELPKEKPNQLPAEGTYYATIESGEMKQGKDTSKPPYLNLRMKLTKKDGTSVGMFFDKIFESEAPLCQFKLGRFLYAIGIDLTKNGVIELSQIAKLVKGKRIIVDIAQTENTYNGRTSMQAVVDINKGECYYRTTDADVAFATEGGLDMDVSDVDVPFIDASDADDTNSTTEKEDY